MLNPGGNRRIECVVCKNELDLRNDISADHACGHYTHMSCYNDDEDDFECAKCVPTANSIANRPSLEEAPTPRDYIDRPLSSKELNSIRGKALRAAAKWGSQKRHVEDVDNPFYWLQKRISLEWAIRSKNGAGLQYMLSNGITIDDFLSNGYTLQDLSIYKDFSTSPERAKRALYALGTTADHLIEYKNALPIATLIGDAFQLRPSEIAKYMGVGFHPTEGLRSPHTDAWQVADMIYLGYNFSDLVKSGMRTRELWDDLGPPTQDEIEALGATWDHVNALPYSRPSRDASSDEDDYIPEIDREEDGREYARAGQRPAQYERNVVHFKDTTIERIKVNDARNTRKRHVGFRNPPK